VARPIQQMRRLFTLAKKERSTSKLLHSDVQAVVQRLEARDPTYPDLLKNAYGYAVFPSVGRASAVLGGSFGKGEVYQNGRLIGYAGILQLTIGVQLGGQTFAEILVFHDRAALERFKQGKVNFAANASAVAVKAGLAATNDKQGTGVYILSDGGLQLETAIGGQKFVFVSAALTRGKSIQHLDRPRHPSF
jgi:lipid-binding SYLF domain-containing protein